MPTETSGAAAHPPATEENAASSSTVKCSLCMACLTPDDVMSPGGIMEGVLVAQLNPRVAAAEQSRIADDIRPNDQVPDEQGAPTVADLNLTRTLSLAEESLLCGRCNELRGSMVLLSRGFRSADEENMEGRIAEVELGDERISSTSGGRPFGGPNTSASILESSLQIHPRSRRSQVPPSISVPSRSASPSQPREPLLHLPHTLPTTTNPPLPAPILSDENTLPTSDVELSGALQDTDVGYEAIALLDGIMLSPRRRVGRDQGQASPPPASRPHMGSSMAALPPRLPLVVSSTTVVSSPGSGLQRDSAGTEQRPTSPIPISGTAGIGLGLGPASMMDNQGGQLQQGGSSDSATVLGSFGDSTLDTLVMTPPSGLGMYNMGSPPPQTEGIGKDGEQVADGRAGQRECHSKQDEEDSKFSAVRPVRPECAPNPYLDFGSSRSSSRGRVTLYPGSLFRGTQTSGRSSYEVEVRIVDVSLAESTLSGYLSICHLTDSHPLLTTFFTGEIIGSKYGFLTGPDYYARATEQDDMRHWSRFEHFRKVKNEIQRPGLTIRDTASTVEGKGRERPFAFMRWKERFLVPDHRVRDISGASFAGFYYLQIDFDPPANYTPPRTTTTVNTISGRPSTPRRSSSSQSRPVVSPRRVSISPTTPDQADIGILAFPPTSPPASFNPPAIPESPGIRTDVSPAPTLARQRSPDNAGSPAQRSTVRKAKAQSLPGVPVLTGYYFHHQNSEPFQELCLHHISQRGSGSFELR